MMNLLYCPNCGAVYIEGTSECTRLKCQSTHEWSPKSLQPVLRRPRPTDGCAVCMHEYDSHLTAGCMHAGCSCKEFKQNA